MLIYGAGSFGRLSSIVQLGLYVISDILMHEGLYLLHNSHTFLLALGQHLIGSYDQLFSCHPDNAEFPFFKLYAIHPYVRASLPVGSMSIPPPSGISSAYLYPLTSTSSV